MADPSTTEEPMTARQTAGGCALLLGLALGLGATAWRGYESAQGVWRSLGGLAVVFMIAGLIVLLRDFRLPAPEFPPSWREAAVRAWPATAGALIAMVVGTALGREGWASWLRLAGTLPALYAGMVLANRYPYRCWRRRNVDPSPPDPLQ